MSFITRHYRSPRRPRPAALLLCLALAMPLSAVAADYEIAADALPQGGMGLAGGAMLGGLSIEPQWSVETDVLEIGPGATLAGEGLNDGLSGSDDSGGIYTLRGVRLLGAGTLAINQGLSLFGKLGVTGLAGNGLFKSGAASGMGLSYSAGGLYSFSPNLSLHAEWDRYTATQGEVDLFSAGIRYDFK